MKFVKFGIKKFLSFISIFIFYTFSLFTLVFLEKTRNERTIYIAKSNHRYKL